MRIQTIRIDPVKLVDVKSIIGNEYNREIFIAIRALVNKKREGEELIYDKDEEYFYKYLMTTVLIRYVEKN